jgi:DNA polymerase III sliding clamp (beta) subunit (PCNA family)
MLTAINTVRGAVATKDLIPILLNISTYDGRLQGGNGRLTIDAPCKELDKFKFVVPCAAFLKAVDACGGEPTITVKDDLSSLTVKKGVFKVTLPCDTSDTFPHQSPEGELLPSFKGSLLEVVKILRPFVSEDASRPWACGILLKEGMAFATNNIIVAGVPSPSLPIPLNLPSFLIDELIRLKQEPDTIRANANSITFMFKDGSWLKGSLLTTEWPDVRRMLPVDVDVVVPDGLLSAVEQISPFCQDTKQPYILLGSFGIQTSEGAKSAQFNGFSLPEAVFRSEPLINVLRAATNVDFSKYPAPCPFVGKDNLKGLIIGVKLS